jgi:hypothetical protein
MFKINKKKKETRNKKRQWQNKQKNKLKILKKK